jgi:hypothetical protein
MTEFRFRDQVESRLGRPLLPDEIEPVDSLDNLKRSQFTVAKCLASKSTLDCLLYLRMAVPNAVQREIRKFIEDVLQAIEPGSDEEA